MGRKIRTGALLILVLAMIYTQQAVIYAQNEAEKNMKKTTESENSDGTNGEDKEPEKPGGEEGDKEPEKPGGEEGDKEQEKPGGEDEDKDKEPEQPEIKRYELEIPKADGKNGYYLSKPSVMITYNGAYGTTVYELKHGEDTLLQGRIKYIVSQEAEEQKTKISLEGEVFEEGKNILHVFMEDEEGNVIGTSRAIDEVDIEAKEGQFIAVLGHNGSGKSTLAKHLNAILVPTEGSVWVNGKNTSNPEELWDVRQSAGMVFQNPDNQIIGTVVEEDVGFGPENLGVPTDEIWQRVEESLKAVGMIEYRHHSPNKLSGGQKQRVAIAGVVAMEPKCIVMDEPTAMLDPVGRKEVLKTVHKLRKQKNVTVILITHYMEEVVDADKIFVMDHGKVVMEGTPKEIFSRVDELKSYRLDVPQVTILADELRKRGLDIPKGILRKEELVEAITHLQQ